MPSSTITNTAPTPTSKTKTAPPPNPSLTALCSHHRHSSATLDLLILLLVLLSLTFLLLSSLSSLLHLLPPPPPPPLLLLLLIPLYLSLSLLRSRKNRRCGKSGCKGLEASPEFDLQLQSEEEVFVSGDVIENLLWKGGSETNADYERLRSELRKMAPANGRAVLMFRARCGCPVAKLEGWGAKRGKRHKK